MSSQQTRKTTFLEDMWTMLIAVKKLGSAISAIGNSKQQEFKKKNTKGKKKNTKPGLGGANKAADPFAGDDEVADFDDFM